MARHYADLPLPGAGAGALVLHNRSCTLFAKRADTDVISCFAAHQQRASRIRDWHTREWIFGTRRPLESPPFLHGSSGDGCCRKHFHSHARSRFIGDSSSAPRGGDMHGRSVSGRYENGGELGRERHGIACGSTCRRVDFGFRLTALSEWNWRPELASDCRSRFGLRRSWCGAYLFCEDRPEIRQSS